MVRSRNVPYIIGSIGQKGGVGKSSCARLVPREYSKAGWDVKIANLDISQATTTDWKKRRDQNAFQPEITIGSFRTVQQA